ncbi:ABC transporter ATP-binding protein [Streptococcus cuniculipharyngis]|uniref:ABC transporter ATP-binding protein n=1 Tax=Streptococcus cuniculipharyngis TaxID=1562651 RepID=A0A5C5SBE5_9STRE|nr:ABC transporter ATP-binding protein [Streptococcus cuniculipharyngis]TWS96656.1 ABC transporter ATP-binding protein [Streptococcus cuniculipharyngis]
MSQIEAKQIRLAYHGKTILNNLSTSIPDQKITCLIGPNGCGKSTLLKSLARIIPIDSGDIFLDGQPISALPTKTIAQHLTLLPQILEAVPGTSVYELVSYGRFPHQRYLGGLSKQDRDKIHWAMEMTEVTSLANSPLERLSGGQRQRVWLAMALAQDTQTIFLDEPTTYLDLNHQLEILELLQQLNKEQQKTIVMVLHDLNQVSRFADHVISMKEGQIYQEGSSQQVLSHPVLQHVFNIDAHLVPDPVTQKPLILGYQLLKS